MATVYLLWIVLYAGVTTNARQIEELLPLPDILHALYGTGRKRRKVLAAEVQAYVAAIRAFRDRIAAHPVRTRKAAIDAILPDDGGE